MKDAQEFKDFLTKQFNNEFHLKPFKIYGMDIILWIIIIIITVKLFIFFLWRKKDWYNDFSNWLQNVGVLLAIVFSIASYIQGSKSLEKTDKGLDLTTKGLDQTQQGLQMTKEGLDITKTSLESSEQVSNKTLDYLGSISGSSNDAKSNLDAISQKLAKFPDQISIIENNLAEISRITKGQMVLAEEIANKKPKLEFIDILCNENEGMHYVFRNTGDFQVSLNKIKITFSDSVYIHDISLNGYGSNNIREFNTQNYNWYEFGEVVQGEDIVLKLGFSYLREHTSSNQIMIKIQIYYNAIQTDQSGILRNTSMLCY